MQIGNAVAPPMSAALGRCLLLAAAEEAPVATPVVEVRLGGCGAGERAQQLFAVGVKTGRLLWRCWCAVVARAGQNLLRVVFLGEGGGSLTAASPQCRTVSVQQSESDGSGRACARLFAAACCPSVPPPVTYIL